MAPQVSTYNSAFNATSLPTTFSTNPTAGDSIFVAVSMFNASYTTVTSVTDNASPSSNTYAPISGSGAQNSGSNNSVVWWSCSNAKLPSSGSLVITESTGSVSQFPGIQAFSFNGTLDVNGIVNTTATGSGTISLTSTVNGDLFLGAMACSNTSGNVSASSWGIQGFDSGNPAFLTTASLTSAPAAGSQTWSMTLPSGDTACLSAVAVKPAGGGGSTSIFGKPALVFGTTGTLAVQKVPGAAPALHFGTTGTLAVQKVPGAAPALHLGVTGTLAVNKPIQGDPLLNFDVRGQLALQTAVAGAPLLRFGVTANLQKIVNLQGAPAVHFGGVANLSASGTAQLQGVPLLRLGMVGNLAKFERQGVIEVDRKRRRWTTYP